MNFEISKRNSYIIFKLRERKLGVEISAELKAEFLVICKPDVKSIIIDLSEVEICDSSGLSALLLCERRMREHGGDVKLVGVSESILKLIKLARIDHLFKFFDTVDEAFKK